MVRVFAQARVGDEHERQVQRAEPSQALLDDPVVGVCPASVRILRVGQAEQEHATDAQPGELRRLALEFIR